MVTAEPIERTAELASVADLAASVAAGEAAVLTITGEAGIGKTALLQAIERRLAESGFSVMTAALSEVEQHLSWAGLRVLCGGVSSDELARLPDANRHAMPAAIGRCEALDVDAARVAFALADLLAARSQQAPVALVIDDLHWLDRATAGVLALAIRSGIHTPLLAVFAHRPIELPIEPDRLLPTHRTVTIDLGGLSVAGLHQLLQQRCGISLGRPDLVRIHATTGGHPLHAIEVGRQIRSGATLDQALVHPSAYEAIAARINTLPIASRQVLLAAALATAPSTAGIRRVLPDLDVEAELDIPIKQQLITMRGDTIQFTHPLVRAAVVADAGPAERRRVRLALADTTGDEDERVALRVAAAAGPDQALAAEVDAAVERALTRDDPQQALELARRAIELTPPGDGLLLAVRLLTAADLAMASGDLTAPIELADRADQLTDDPELRFRGGVIRMLTLGNGGHEEIAVAASEPLLELLASDRAKCARIYDIRAQTLLRTNVPVGLINAEQALADARIGGDPDQIIREEALVTMVRVLAGEPVDLDAVAQRAAAIPDTTVAKDWLADALSFCDRSSTSLAISLEQLEAYRRIGAVHFEAAVRGRVCGDLVAMGRYDEAIRGYTEWLDLQSMIGGVPAAGTYAERAYALAVSGRRTEAEADLARAVDDHSAALIDSASVWGRVCQIRSLWGEWSSAADAGIQAAAIARRVGAFCLGAAPFRPAVVEALLHVGRTDDAQAIADELERIVAGSGEPRGRGDSARCRAAIAAASGDLATATAAWRTAIDGYRSISAPLEVAIALLGLGSGLRRAGKRNEASEALHEALSQFVALSAQPYMSIVDAELERLGRHRSANASQLTPTELQIAEHVAAGRSNAEIAKAMSISLRTVESNLTKTYRKLNVRSRTELAAAWHAGRAPA